MGGGERGGGLRAQLVGGHRVGEAVHLPQVPRHHLRRLVELLVGGSLAPARAQVLGEGLQHVDSCDEQVVALVLEGVGCLERRERPLEPFLACLGLLAHHAEFSVKEAHALGHGQGAAGHGVIAAAHERCLAAGDLEPGGLHVGVPPVPLGLGELDRLGCRGPAPRALVVHSLGVEGVAPPEPRLIDVVVHLVAQPRGREHLGAALCALALPLGLLGDARLDDAAVRAAYLLDSYLVGARIPLAQALVLVVGPDDVLARRAVGQQRLQHVRGVAAAEAPDEVLVQNLALGLAGVCLCQPHVALHRRSCSKRVRCI